MDEYRIALYRDSLKGSPWIAVIEPESSVSSCLDVFRKAALLAARSMLQNLKMCMPFREALYIWAEGASKLQRSNCLHEETDHLRRVGELAMC